MKKVDQATSQPVDQEDEVLAEGASTEVLHANIPVVLTEHVIFSIGKWGEFTQWKCMFCPWDTLEGEEVMMEHWRTTHAPAPEPPKASMIARADRYGNEIRE